MAHSCYVIMPYTVRPEDAQKYHQDHWRDVYQGLVIPAVEKAGLLCHRDDDDFVSRPITQNIWKKIEEADIILCDISAHNPNAFLELGWALRADKPFVLIMDELTLIPHNLNQFYRFNYSHDLRPISLKQQIPHLAEVISKTLLDPNERYSILNSLSLSSNIGRPRCSVDIYYYDEQGLTRKYAQTIAQKLQEHEMVYRLFEHDDPDGPDAIFIGALVGVEDARLVISMVPYEINFLFRPDYPESDGGDSTGCKIGIGYSSRYNAGRRGKRSEPVAVSTSQLAALLDNDHTNTSFQKLLWEMTMKG
jgi:hypothetical protein